MKQDLNSWKVKALVRLLCARQLCRSCFIVSEDEVHYVADLVDRIYKIAEERWYDGAKDAVKEVDFDHPFHG